MMDIDKSWVDDLTESERLQCGIKQSNMYADAVYTPDWVYVLLLKIVSHYIVKDTDIDSEQAVCFVAHEIRRVLANRDLLAFYTMREEFKNEHDLDK